MKKLAISLYLASHDIAVDTQKERKTLNQKKSEYFVFVFFLFCF